ncbi:hypothetical protein F5J12DRAFT_842315 [Pisolithus orientalis]|uniref:uncharacterized protein n=1 Tax=Pisolithus orientalis TaxID=936130 RepID=UPI002224BD7E|nr:uncharacterized protein F5J12DRAFT_842315 [Pisolithus orientalis]KAI6002292.1 hypothetical protein F5J12DRAFT_842315 [Pisolithus orientalis]
MVELCSFLLIAQAIAQLICVPQSNLFGQLMFVVSIATSWVYNLWFLSFDKAGIRQEIFRSVLGSPKLEKFVFPNRSSAIVSLLLLSGDNQKLSGDSEKLKKIMDALLPSGALVWETWKKIIIQRLQDGLPLRFEESDWNRQGLTFEPDRLLLETLLKDAEAAYVALSNGQ